MDDPIEELNQIFVKYMLRCANKELCQQFVNEVVAWARKYEFTIPQEEESDLGYGREGV